MINYTGVYKDLGLAALEHLKNSHKLLMGEMLLAL